jgi:transketolase
MECDVMTAEERAGLELTACRVRKGILDATHAAKSGHPGGSLGAAEIFTCLYFKEMDIDPKTPRKKDRDRFVLSKGHTAPGLYSALANRGYFPPEDLLTLRRPGSHLQGHPSMNATPGVDMSTGSLGQGVSAACGMALAARVNGAAYRVYTLMGDGEIEEGECWEAFMFAAHHKLDNLCVIIDVNGLQIDGFTREVMSAEPIDEKLRAFGFEVFTVDGNCFDELETAFGKARLVKGRPSALVARTTKGKGVAFMENKAAWHGTAPNDEQYAEAVAEVSQTYRAKGGEGNV